MNIVNGLDIGKRAITTHTETIRVAGQNITNVNTEGYSRQKLELKTASYDGGIKVNQLRSYRARDNFIDSNIRSENQALGDWDIRAQMYDQIENAFLEPSEYGLNNVISKFWNGWADLANDNQSAAPRSVILQQGAILAESLNQLDSQLKNLRGFADDYIDNRITEINDIGAEIARSNTEIVSLEVSGDEASELRDNRDLLLEKLSRLADISVVERESSSMAVMIGGRSFIDDGVVSELGTERVASDDMMVNNIIWAIDDTDARISGGELSGLLAVRDEIIPDIQDKLDTLAATIIQEINDIHSGGYGADGTTGEDFFTGTDASDIAVSTVLLGDVNKVAASETLEAGGNAVALELAALGDQAVAPDSRTIGAYYSGILEDIGAESQSATMMKGNSEMLVGYLEERRESVAGVSLDEETADLIRFQRAYQSAAHYMSVINDLIGVLMEIG